MQQFYYIATGCRGIQSSVCCMITTMNALICSLDKRKYSCMTLRRLLGHSQTGLQHRSSSNEYYKGSFAVHSLHYAFAELEFRN